MLLASVGEVINIGTVLPFLGALTEPDKVFHHEYAQIFIQVFGITQSDQLLFPLTIVFSVAVILSGVLRLSLLWTQSRLGYAIGADISKKTDYLIQAVQESVGGIRDVIINATQEIHCKIFREIDISLRHSQASNQLINESPKFGVEMLVAERH